MTTANNGNFSDWIGRSEEKHDLISSVLARRMAATLGKPAPKKGEALPPLWHWMFFQAELFESELGRDGHPALGGFLPPAHGRNRMWAGGSFEFKQPFIVGKAASCVSTIEAVKEKQGKTGSLLFVTVRHEYSQDDKPLFVERQNIVYREPTAPKLNADPAPKAQWQQSITPSSTLLFRYSALTFNGHRIHYDYPYVTKTEGYSNLVIHGPLMATLVLDAFCCAHTDKTVHTFSYRGVRPANLGARLDIAGALNDDNSAKLWIGNEAGLIQQADITFS